MRFENKVAIITGAAKGIGQATLQAFAREGASVVGVDNDAQGLDETIKALQGTGAHAHGVVADVSSNQATQRIVAETLNTFGGIDFLCNVAGIQTYGTVVETDEDTWDRTLDVNLKSIYLMARYCIPEIIKRGGGAVVNMASTQGLASEPRVAAYAASKGGVIAMTNSMAVDHAVQNIRVNCICPGSVDTPMLRYSADIADPNRDAQAIMAEWGLAQPIGRLARAEEIASVYVFLCSKEASFITGAHIVVDGGLMARLG